MAYYSSNPPTPDREFTSDGCSGGMSWLWNKIVKTTTGNDLPWEKCCVDHDHAYFLGGTWFERLKADAKLLADVAMNGYPHIAVLMFLGVRIGGSPFFPFSWRWGYGYKYKWFFQNK